SSTAAALTTAAGIRSRKSIRLSDQQVANADTARIDASGSLTVCRDAVGERLEPGLNAVAEEADTDQYHNGDSCDQQAVLDDVLTVFVAKELEHRIHRL